MRSDIVSGGGVAHTQIATISTDDQHASQE